MSGVGGVGGSGSVNGGVPFTGTPPTTGGSSAGSTFGISSLTNSNGQVILSQQEIDAMNALLSTVTLEQPMKTYTIHDLFTANFALIELAHAIAEGWRTDMRILISGNYNVADFISYSVPPDITDEELAALNEAASQANADVLALRESNKEYNDTVATPQNDLVSAYEACLFANQGDASTCGTDPGERLPLLDENTGILQPLLVRPLTVLRENSTGTAIGTEQISTGIDIETIDPGELGADLKEILSRPDSVAGSQTSIVGLGLAIYRGAVNNEVVGVIDQILNSEALEIFRERLNDAYFPPEVAPPLAQFIIDRAGDGLTPGLQLQTPFPPEIESLIESGFLTADQIKLLRSLTIEQIIILGGPGAIQELALQGKLTVEQLSTLLNVIFKADVVPVDRTVEPEPIPPAPRVESNTPPVPFVEASTVELLRAVTGREVRPILIETLNTALADVIIPVQFQALSETVRAREAVRDEVYQPAEEAAIIRATVQNILLQSQNEALLAGLIAPQVERYLPDLNALQQQKAIEALLLVTKQTLLEVAEILLKREVDQNSADLFDLNTLQVQVRDAKIQVRNEYESINLQGLSDTLKRVFERELSLGNYLQEFIDPGRTLLNIYSAFNKKLPDKELEIDL